MSLKRLAFAAFTAPLLPAALATVSLHPRLRAHAAARLGLRLPPVGPGVVWLHAASLGETRGALALAARLPGPILITVDTDTAAGLAEAALNAHAGRVVIWPLPLDHPLCLAPLWARARPRLLAFVEGSFWPQLAALAAEEGVPVLRVAGKAGSRTAWWAERGLALPFSGVVRATAGRDPTAGLPMTWVGGDPKQAAHAPVHLGWRERYLVGASTRPGDEAALIAALPALPEALGLLLAPRHPERFHAVAALLDESGFVWARRSAGLPGPGPRVLLLDRLGELGGCYAGAAAGFVGGTFDASVGGHSPAEALAAGVPVVAGPARWANPHAFEGAHLAPTPAALADALRLALAAPRPAPTAADLGPLAAWLADQAGPIPPERPARPSLRPAQPLVSAVDRLRRATARSWRPPVPVWAVGSPLARGPGRTRTTRALAAVLRAQGERVGVVCRAVADEAALHRRDGSVVVAGGGWRAGVERLHDEGCTHILLDDGLAALDVRCARRWWVVDADTPTGAAPIPAGEARWRTDSPDADGVILFGHRWAPPRPLPVVLAERCVGPWMLGEGQLLAPPPPIALFAGVSRPEGVLRSWGHPIARFQALPDHAPIDAAGFARLRAWAGPHPLACTAKDWVRLPPELAEGVLWRDAGARLLSPLPPRP